MEAAPSESGEKRSQSDLSSPEVLVPEVEGGELKLKTIEELHSLLVSRYVDIIDRISQRGLLPPAPDISGPRRFMRSLLSRLEHIRTPQPNAWRRRPMTRALVESHVKRKLQELQGIYAQVEQSLLTVRRDNTQLKEWLKSTQDACSRLASTLTSWASIRGLIALFWPAVLGLATAWLGVDSIWKAIWSFIGHEKLPTLESGLVGKVLFIMMYSGPLIDYIFGRKRRLFLDEVPIAHHVELGLRPKMNTYELEDALFNYLHKQKKLETPLDYLGNVVFFGPVTVLSLIWAITDTSLSAKVVGLSTSFFGAFFIIGIYIANRRESR